MQMREREEPVSEGQAIGLGCLVGLLAGIGLGGGIVLLLDGFESDMWVIVMPHTILSMVAMGAWAMPSLFSRED